jgi:hypothetical protein
MRWLDRRLKVRLPASTTLEISQRLSKTVQRGGLGPKREPRMASSEALIIVVYVDVERS